MDDKKPENYRRFYLGVDISRKQAQEIEELRLAAKSLADKIEELVPESYEQLTAMTLLADSISWASKGITLYKREKLRLID